MNHFHRIIRGFSGVLLALGLLSTPLAFVYASGSASITSLSSSVVNVGSGVDFTVQTSGFTNPTFQVNDSFSGSSVTSSDFNSSEGYFAWTPTSNDVGTHNITFTISDSSGDSTSVTQTITVTQSNTPALVIQNISPGTSIGIGQAISFFALAMSFPETPTYSVSDNFNGSSINSTNISNSGEFSWTPTSSDIGTHTITITATDSSGDNTSVEETVTVSSSPSTSNSSSSSISVGIESLSTTNAAVGQPVTFDAVASGFTNPNYTLSDSFAGSTISNADINSSGDFSWTPSTSDIGTHNITVSANDSSGHSSTISQTIVVQGAGVVISNLSPGAILPAQTPLTFTASDSNATSPVYTISDTFGGSTVSNSDINTSGSFNWTPTTNDVGDHTFTITARSSNGALASTNLQITVLSAGSAITSSVPSTSSIPSYSFTTSMYPGLQGQDVTNLQTLLTKEGLYSGPITGYFGSLTQAAVETFQNNHGISAIGTVGPLTIAALNQLTGTTAPTNTTTTSNYDFTTLLSVGSTGAAVTALQQKLTSLGIYSGPITSYFGALTEAAVKAFQSAHSIPAVGYVGPATRAALNS